MSRVLTNDDFFKIKSRINNSFAIERAIHQILIEKVGIETDINSRIKNDVVTNVDLKNAINDFRTQKKMSFNAQFIDSILKVLRIYPRPKIDGSRIFALTDKEYMEAITATSKQNPFEKAIEKAISNRVLTDSVITWANNVEAEDNKKAKEITEETNEKLSSEVKGIITKSNIPMYVVIIGLVFVGFIIIKKA